jgi:asparagine synthase (glutamine-hydrolysing)
MLENATGSEYQHWKAQWLAGLNSIGGMNDLLQADCRLVLPNDMLTKVDLMSMANNLEVRVPFLDYRVVDFAFSQRSDYKIDRKQRKKLVQDTFRSLLPAHLYNRPKKGFEVPLLKWLRRELRSMVEDQLNEKFIRDQGIFNPGAVSGLKSRLFSHNPGDSHARIWALLVFQSWWTRYHRPS